MGSFGNDEEAAARAYDEAARRMKGAEAKLNFPDDIDDGPAHAAPSAAVLTIRMGISPLPPASHDSDMGDLAPPGFSAPASPPPPLVAPSAAEPQPPCFALTVADLAPPPLWLFRAPASGEVMGPFLISALRRSVQVGDITARDARLLRVWRQGEPEGAPMSLQQALELPMLRARSLQLQMLRARHAAP